MNSRRNFLNTLESGRVTRYHCAPSVAPQNLAHHQWNVAVILLHLTGNNLSETLLLEALFHDVDEYFTGDVPFTMKRDHPTLKSILKDVAKEHRDNDFVLPSQDLTTREEALLKVADTLDGMLWTRDHEEHAGPIHGRWTESYLIAKHKFQHELTPEEWQRADALFQWCGGVIQTKIQSA